MRTGGRARRARRAVEAGVSGYLLKGRPAAEIVKAIRRAAAGEILLPPDELASLLRLAANGRASATSASAASRSSRVARARSSR